MTFFYFTTRVIDCQWRILEATICRSSLDSALKIYTILFLETSKFMNQLA